MAGTCWWSFGIGYVACTATSALDEAAVTADCEFSEACYPVVCGTASFLLHLPTCCLGDEVCFDGVGHCCLCGEQAYASKACCAADQNYIAAELQSTCCQT
jgi:hypothetical protein